LSALDVAGRVEQVFRVQIDTNDFVQFGRLSQLVSRIDELRAST